MCRNTKQGIFLLSMILAITSFKAQGAFGQDQEIIETLQDGNNYVRTMILQAADEMLEDDYSFRPVPEVRSFGELLAHVAGSNYFFCSAATGETAPIKDVEENITKREDILEVLSESFDYCNKAYDAADINADTRVEFMGKNRSPLTVLTFRNNHTLLHYGNVITYMRLRGKIPPSSQEPAGSN